MTIIWDEYFWLALGYVLAGVLSAILFVAFCLRYKRFGKIAGGVLLVVVITYDLAQCSNIIANDIRLRAVSKVEQP